MEANQASNLGSLMGRELYSVCYPPRDGVDSLQGEFALARKKFFAAGGKRAVRVGKSEIVKGFDGRLKGKLSRRGCYWKKAAGKLTLEEAFDQKNGYVLVRRDFRGVIVGRTYFDQSHAWLKSEYFDPDDPSVSQVIFKPHATADLVERFDWSPADKRYTVTVLNALAYLPGTPEQSLLNARFGEPEFLVSCQEGEFSYCTRQEAQERLRTLHEIRDGTIVLMPAWEVRDGAVAGEEPAAEETVLDFTSLEEAARVEPGQETQPLAETVPPPPILSDTAEFTPVTPEEESAAAMAELTGDWEPREQEEGELEQIADQAEAGIYPQPEPGPAAPEPLPLEERGLDEDFLAAVRKAPIPTETLAPAAEEPASTEEPAAVEEPIDEVEQPGLETALAPASEELAAYRGEAKEGRREGFGAHYDRNGALSYAGFWKDDKKEGLGVSFRESDHALHIAKWKDGRPESFVTLFDQNGNLRYSGRIEGGKKQGAGVSIDPETGSVFVGKWVDGQRTGLGSSFDRDGNLLYYGEWKDGRRNGHGTEFDKAGGVVFDGEWLDDKYHNGVLYQKLRQEPPEGEDA